MRCQTWPVNDLERLTDLMRVFARERDWEKFHDPKSLTLALMGEVGELAEILQWLPVESAVELCGVEPLRRQVGDELADILLYLVRLSDVLGIDLGQESTRKLAEAAKKYPPEDFSGIAPMH